MRERQRIGVLLARTVSQQIQRGECWEVGMDGVPAVITADVDGASETSEQKPQAKMTFLCSCQPATDSVEPSWQAEQTTGILSA